MFIQSLHVTDISVIYKGVAFEEMSYTPDKALRDLPKKVQNWLKTRQAQLLENAEDVRRVIGESNEPWVLLFDILADEKSDKADSWDRCYKALEFLVSNPTILLDVAGLIDIDSIAVYLPVATGHLNNVLKRARQEASPSATKIPHVTRTSALRTAVNEERYIDLVVQVEQRTSVALATIKTSEGIPTDLVDYIKRDLLQINALNIAKPRVDISQDTTLTIKLLQLAAIGTLDTDTMQNALAPFGCDSMRRVASSFKPDEWAANKNIASSIYDFLVVCRDPQTPQPQKRA